MTGACAAASRSIRAVRVTIPGRAGGGWNFDSGSSKPSFGAAPPLPPEITEGSSMTSGFTLPNVTPLINNASTKRGGRGRPHPSRRQRSPGRNCGMMASRLSFPACLAARRARRARPGDVDQPADAEPVGAHAEGVAPWGRGERYGDSTVRGQFFPVAAQLSVVVAAQRYRIVVARSVVHAVGRV